MIGQTISHYRLADKLGEGTYGVVYRGVHIHDDELVVAIKVVHPNLANDEAFVSGLRKECRLLAKLVHPNIVSFRDLVLSDDHPPAMVLELLEGEDLYTRIGRGPMAPAEAARILEAVLEGLAAAHKKDVVHRDIKPSNIVLCTDGTVKLLDFGIARAADTSQATKTGVIQGTLDYVAPEVFSGDKATAAADVYATGLVVWEMLTGRVACAEGSLGAKVGWHMGVGPGDLRVERPDCPGWLAEVVHSLAAKEPADRPADAVAAQALFAARRQGGGAPATAQAPTQPDSPARPGTVTIGSAVVADAVASVDGDSAVVSDEEERFAAVNTVVPAASAPGSEPPAVQPTPSTPVPPVAQAASAGHAAPEEPTTGIAKQAALGCAGFAMVVAVGLLLILGIGVATTGGSVGEYLQFRYRDLRCDLGASQRCELLGDGFAIHGILGGKNLPRAAEYYAKACDLGKMNGCYEWAKLVMDEAVPGDMSLAKRRLATACNRVHMPSCSLLENWK